MLCKAPSNFTANNGIPTGLTRNAITSRMIPFFTDTVSITNKARTERIALASLNTNAVQEIRPAQSQTSREIVSVTGAANAFRMGFMDGASFRFLYYHYTVYESDHKDTGKAGRQRVLPPLSSLYRRQLGQDDLRGIQQIVILCPQARQIGVVDPGRFMDPLGELVKIGAGPAQERC